MTSYKCGTCRRVMTEKELETINKIFGDINLIKRIAKCGMLNCTNCVKLMKERDKKIFGADYS